jgi:hypothetical protein
LDVTISLTGSAGLRPAWPRRAIAIAGAGVAVVAVAARFREHPRVLALLAAAGSAGVFAVVMRGAGWGQRLGLASGRTVRFVMGGLGGCHRDW